MPVTRGLRPPCARVWREFAARARQRTSRDGFGAQATVTIVTTAAASWARHAQAGPCALDRRRDRRGHHVALADLAGANLGAFLPHEGFSWAVLDREPEPGLHYQTSTIRCLPLHNAAARPNVVRMATNSLPSVAVAVVGAQLSLSIAGNRPAQPVPRRRPRVTPRAPAAAAAADLVEPARPDAPGKPVAAAAPAMASLSWTDTVTLKGLGVVWFTPLASVERPIAGFSRDDFRIRFARLAVNAKPVKDVAFMLQRAAKRLVAPL